MRMPICLVKMNEMTAVEVILFKVINIWLWSLAAANEDVRSATVACNNGFVKIFNISWRESVKPLLFELPMSATDSSY